VVPGTLRGSSGVTVTRLVLSVLLLGACRQQVNWLPDPPWSSVPITVEWSAIDSTFDSSLVDAMGAWNHAAGCTVLVRAHDDANANVSVSAYDGSICGSSALNDLDRPGAGAGAARCSLDRAQVKFRSMPDLMEVYVRGGHNFGHVLGIAHDRSALMQESPPLDRMIWPSDADGAAVGARYCR
jgi:hypothetical protein